MQKNKPTPLIDLDWEWYRRSKTEETFTEIAKSAGVKVAIVRYRVRKCQKAEGVLPVEPDQDEIIALQEADRRWSAIVNRPRSAALLGEPPVQYSALHEKRVDEDRRRSCLAEEFALRRVFARDHSNLDRGDIRVSDLTERMRG